MTDYAAKVRNLMKLNRVSARRPAVRWWKQETSGKAAKRRALLPPRREEKP
jgi:hypothetical protein